jgi:YVTN family beta-propeller protein
MRCGAACVDVANDRLHCGGCGMVCRLPNATAACEMGTCTVGRCQVGYYDTNRIPADGCENDGVPPLPAPMRFARAGIGADQTPAEAISLVVPAAGQVYVLSYNDKNIVFDGDGRYVRAVPAMGWSTAWDLAVDPASGEMWVVDPNFNRIDHLDLAGRLLESWTGLSGPRGLRFVRGELYATDYGGHRIVVYTRDGMIRRTMRAGGLLNAPRGLDVDAAGNVYVANSGNNTILVVSAADAVLRSIPTCSAPSDVAHDEVSGRIYVLCEAGDQWIAYRSDGTRLYSFSTEGAVSHNGIDTSPDGSRIYVAFNHYANRGVQMYTFP